MSTHPRHAEPLLGAALRGLDCYANPTEWARMQRNAMRQDPDVIMVGEMRDMETIQTVLTAAETARASAFATIQSMHWLLAWPPGRTPAVG